jgi:pyruvate dehydrogenase E1 component alpha subunit
MSDPAKYRTQAELEEHKKRDPLVRARTRLVELGMEQAAPGALETLEKSVEAEVADAVKFAQESPEPGLDVLESATYAGPFAY